MTAWGDSVAHRACLEFWQRNEGWQGYRRYEGATVLARSRVAGEDAGATYEQIRR